MIREMAHKSHLSIKDNLMTFPDQNYVVPAVEMKDIVLQFPGVLANDHVNFTLMPGEIHALLGETAPAKAA